METPLNSDVKRIQQAIEYLTSHFREQPPLERIATEVSMSPYHFQRTFVQHAGISPKKFLQYLSITHAKQLIRRKGATLFDVAEETGLSGTGRLHDLFLSIEQMTPGEYKNGGRGLNIRYSYMTTIFGDILTASTDKGICYMGFSDARTDTLRELRQLFPEAAYTEELIPLHADALTFLKHDFSLRKPLNLHLKGTPFQIKVWEALLRVPSGETTTYGTLATEIDSPKACRAVGSAVGSNPVSLLIPCHRVIQSTGAIGGYHWGPERKTALLSWETALDKPE